MIFYMCIFLNSYIYCGYILNNYIYGYLIAYISMNIN